MIFLFFKQCRLYIAGVAFWLGKHVHLDKKFCACHECDTDRTVCRLYLPTNRLSAMLLIRAIFSGSGADFKKACGAEMKKSCIKQLFSFINHAV
ncbi:hypothetical protein ACPCXE_04335 [Bacillus velezensis]|uniref:hypothetical protein n=1 Tax=Bacillus TaxID=1386 RepID=UPI00026B9F92|nr:MULTISPECIES: hypothetical protein [Bacillus]AIW30942.1 hypothetical protein KO64_14030 [Bacillus subtilis]AZG40047.1 hypothetical protein EG219_13490 [Bacillus velezensis]EJD67714.1 hypothetical protein BB65665_10031 [Bacillus sp. 916]MBU8885126.1 hypothetical protein [Bacillus sp. FJAT-27001]MCP1532520.1 hypothetical protein [Bacillus velezensis]